VKVWAGCIDIDANEKRVNMKKIYLGNLSPSTTEEEVRDLVAEHGAIESVRTPTGRKEASSLSFGLDEAAVTNTDTTIIGLAGELGGGLEKRPPV